MTMAIVAIATPMTETSESMLTALWDFFESKYLSATRRANTMGEDILNLEFRIENSELKIDFYIRNSAF